MSFFEAQEMKKNDPTINKLKKLIADFTLML
jgi:hypothetical protein